MADETILNEEFENLSDDVFGSDEYEEYDDSDDAEYEDSAEDEDVEYEDDEEDYDEDEDAQPEEKTEIKPENISSEDTPLTKGLIESFIVACENIAKSKNYDINSNEVMALVKVFASSELRTKTVIEYENEVFSLSKEDEALRGVYQFWVGFFIFAKKGGIDFNTFVATKGIQIGFKNMSPFIKNIFEKVFHKQTEVVMKVVDGMQKVIRQDVGCLADYINSEQRYFSEDIKTIVEFVCEKRTKTGEDKVEVAKDMQRLAELLKNSIDEATSKVMKEWDIQYTPSFLASEYIGVLGRCNGGYTILRRTMPYNYYTVDVEADQFTEKIETYMGALADKLAHVGILVEDASGLDSASIIHALYNTYNENETNKGAKNKPQKYLYFTYIHQELLSHLDFYATIDNIKSAPAESCSSAQYFKARKEYVHELLFAATRFFLNERYPKWRKFNKADNSKELNNVTEFANYVGACLSTTVIITDLCTHSTSSKLSGMTISVVDVDELKVMVACAKGVDFSFDTINRDKIRLAISENVEPLYQTMAGGKYTMRHLADYMSNKQFVWAQPSFAYHALHAIQHNGGKLDYKSVLLGKGLDDNLFQCPDLSEHKMHWIFAGSRSGKGVMSYNIFATAFASGVPIFYCDRKPDTSVALRSITENDPSQTGLFVVNGGQSETDFITADKKFFEKYNNSKTYRIPSIAKNILPSPDNVQGLKVLRDCAYFKGFLTVLEMGRYISAHRGNSDNPFIKEIRQAGYDPTKPIICVLDEFSRYVNDTCRNDNFIYSVAFMYSKCIKATVLTSKASEYDKLVNDLKTNQMNAANKQDAVSSASDKGRSKAELELAKAKTSVQTKEDAIQRFEDNDLGLGKIYATHLVECANDIFNWYSEQISSGGKSLDVQIYVIGQRFTESIIQQLQQDTTTGDSGTNNSKYINQKSNFPLLKRMTEGWGRSTDFIVGYNKEENAQNGWMDSSEGGTDKITGVVTAAGSNEDKLNGSRRMFAYRAFSGNIVDVMNSICSKDAEFAREGYWKYFKPYLILNDSATPPYCVGSDGKIDEEKTHKFWGNEGSDKPTWMAGTGEIPAQYKPLSKDLSKLEAEQYVGQTLAYAEKAGINSIEILRNNCSDETDKLGDGKRHELQMHSGVGIGGYMYDLMGGKNESGMSYLDSVSMSGRMMDAYIKHVYGYTGTYQEFMCDFRPQYFPGAYDPTTSAVHDFEAACAKTFLNPALEKNFIPRHKSDYASIGLYLGNEAPAKDGADLSNPDWIKGIGSHEEKVEMPNKAEGSETVEEPKWTQPFQPTQETVKPDVSVYKGNKLSLEEEVKLRAIAEFMLKLLEMNGRVIADRTKALQFTMDWLKQSGLV